MKIALIQFKSSMDPEDNRTRVTEKIREIKDANMIILPESFIYPFGTEFENKTEELKKYFSELAKEKEMIIVAGTIPEVKGDKVYNTSFVFDSNGAVIGKHRKVYLYDVDLPDLKTRESDRFNRGNKATVFDTPFGKFGLLICYDLRFDHLFLDCARAGAHTIILPASFSSVTGPKHWETLLKARALDSQCFVIGCGAAKNKEASFIAHGNSLMASPDGIVIDSCGDDEEVLILDYNPNDVNIIRERIPVLRDYERNRN